MPVFQLPDELVFPHPSLADDDGLLAVGGDLSPQRLILAYSNGIFPWYVEGEPILWWSPHPRCVLFPHKFKIPKSLRKFIRTHHYRVDFDNRFEEVIRSCATIERKGQTGKSWITPQMQEAYIALHRMGFAHSVEIYDGEQLVGGLYGVSIGKAFFGESMFHRVPNASKLALIALVTQLKHWNFDIIDNQQTTPLLLQFGAEEINREHFLNMLAVATQKESITGHWQPIDGIDMHIRNQAATTRPL